MPSTRSLSVLLWRRLARAVLLTGACLAAGSVLAAPAAAPLLSSTRVAFGDHAGAATSRITITNTGAAGSRLTVTGLALSGAGAHAFRAEAGDCSRPLAARASCALTVRFAPPSTGRFEASLKVATDAAAPVAVALAGSNLLRPLPALYSTASAIAYSPYRSCGPPCGEVPSNADILQDLSLLSKAGFTLLRNYASDSVGANIVALAAANYPTLKFQLGVYLDATSSACVDSSGNNASQIANAIALANTYPGTVVTVSVGNETQQSGSVPISCLAGYISQVRAAIAQPVTTDDTGGFYAGYLASKPDSILRLVDFVSMHTYPFLETAYWNWQQLSVRAGSQRASAMMNAALVQAQDDFLADYNYVYVGTGGTSVNEGSQLPMVVGETGWKGYETNAADPIEVVANPAIANPVNVKWYINLLDGWRGANEGPVAIFLFEAFDEPWKGSDDGWGLWLVSRSATYALCGTPADKACNRSIYKGAGYYH